MRVSADVEGFLDSRAERLDAFLDEQGLEAVWFAQPNSFAWLTGGDNVVARTGATGVAAAGYDGEFRVVTDNIEAQRLLDEELPDAFAVEEFTWHASSLADAVVEKTASPAAADFDVPGTESVDASSLRRPLTDRDVDVYRRLGSEAATALETAARSLTPETTERTAEARIREELTARGIESPVVLVGGEKRAQAYRHFTPKDEPLGGYAVLSITAQRSGLFASTTRTVAFDPPAWLDERTEKTMRVDTTALAATRDAARNGGTAGDVFDAITEAYDAVGFDGEWQHHHQGGAAGFAGREWFAAPDAETPVEAPMAYAWNPTIQGTKSEDTYLVTEDGFEVLTATGDWPTTTADAVGYDVSLDRHGVYRVE